MDLTVGHIQALLAVDEHGSFTRAAGALGLTQSAVSRTIAALEHRLCGRLIHRGPDGASLTALGRQVAEHSHAVIGHLRAIEALAQLLVYRPSGPSCTCSPSKATTTNSPTGSPPPPSTWP